MSHISTIAVKILDLAALKKAVEEHGCIFVEGQTTYRWYGESVGDYPLPVGMKVEDLGKCTHAIRIPGVNYEIGVVKQKDGSYTLAFDFFGYEKADFDPKRHDATVYHDGQKLLAKFGDGLKKLCQSYAVCKATIVAKAKGYMVQRTTLKNGSIKLVLTGV